ncbi:MAG: hypothetical protein R2864_08630 [Syntrophotaleaceae bacterium]
MSIEQLRGVAPSLKIKRSLAVSLVVLAASLAMLLTSYYAFVQPRLLAYRFSALKPLAARIDQLRGQAPVYCLKEDEPISLIYYYGRVIPAASPAEVSAMIRDKKPFYCWSKISTAPRWTGWI